LRLKIYPDGGVAEIEGVWRSGSGVGPAEAIGGQGICGSREWRSGAGVQAIMFFGHRHNFGNAGPAAT